jgi:hypothetical protein
MKLNFNVQLTNLNGAPLVQRVVDPEGGFQTNEDGSQKLDEKGAAIPKTIDQDVIASDLICTALLTPYQDEQPSTDDKNVRFLLAERINKAHNENTDAVLSSEEATLVKTLVGKMYAPLIVGQVVRIIES